MSPRLQDDLSFQLLLDSFGVTLVQRPVLLDQLPNDERYAVFWTIVFQIKLVPFTCIPQEFWRVPLKFASTHEERPAQDCIHELHEPGSHSAFGPPRIGHVLADHHPAARLEKIVESLYGLLGMWNTTKHASAANLIKHTIRRQSTFATDIQNPALMQCWD